MPTANEPYTTYDRGWIVRIAPPKAQPAPGQPLRSLLLLHGRTGDETVMWIFARNMPANTWIFAPRGPLEDDGGYAWAPSGPGWPSLADLSQVCARLMVQFKRWTAETGAPFEQFDVMGFSQGAAMAYALAAFYPQQVKRVIALAGFLPREEPFPGRYSGFSGKSVYIAHGEKDQTVPIRMAQEAVERLEQVGAKITYCASDVGHKMGASCLRGLEDFMSAG